MYDTGRGVYLFGEPEKYIVFLILAGKPPPCSLDIKIRWSVQGSDGRTGSARKDSKLFKGNGRLGKAQQEQPAFASRSRSRQEAERKGQIKKSRHLRGSRRVSGLPNELPRESEATLLLELIKCNHGSFRRFFKIYTRSRVETGDSTPLQPAGESTITLFPSKLPWDKPPGKSRGRRGPQGKLRWEAYKWLVVLWGQVA